MQEMGNAIEVVSLDDPKAEFVKNYSLRLHALGPGLTQWAFSSNLVNWLGANATRYDAIVVDGIWQHHGLAARAAALRAGVPYFVFPHGMLDPWFKTAYPLKHLKKWLVWPWADYRVLRDARAVLFTCEEERRLAKKSFWLYKANAIVVPFGTARPPAETPEMHAQFYAEQPQLSGKRILLFLGRIHEKKGCDLLVEAFCKVAKQEPLLHLVMAGPGNGALVESLKARIETYQLSDRVHWTGMLQGATKWGAFYASEAFVLPSHQENFGVAVAEALACGRPVLISNKVNIWREIAEGRAGFVSQDTDQGTEDLLKEWLKTTPTQKRALQLAALQTFERKFSVDIMASGTLAAIENML